MIEELYTFQKYYFKKILKNISDDILFDKTPNEVNSPGWILVHLIIEIEDIFNYLEIEIKPLPQIWFQDNASKRINYNNLPNKIELLKIFEFRYDCLMKIYTTMTIEEKSKKHPSTMFSEIYSTVDSWVTHHLITHFAVHIGNVATWKKANGLKVDGI